MSKRAEVLATLTAAACEFALDNVEQFRLHMETQAREAGKGDLAEVIPDTDNLSAGLALAGLAAVAAAEQAARPKPDLLSELFGGGIGVTVMGPYTPDELKGQLPPELVELLAEVEPEQS